MTLASAIYKQDKKIIKKLNRLTDSVTFWSDVERLTELVSSDFLIERWNELANERFAEITSDEFVRDNFMGGYYKEI